MKIRKNGNIKELNIEEFVHEVMLYITHNNTDYDNEEMHQIANELTECDYEYVLNNYDEIIKKYDIDILAKMIGVKIIKY